MSAYACPVCAHDIGAHDDDRCLACAAEPERKGWMCGMSRVSAARTRLAHLMEPDCRTCGGTGEVRHPRWGASNCPEPTTVCPTCQGEQP